MSIFLFLFSLIGENEGFKTPQKAAVLRLQFLPHNKPIIPDKKIIGGTNADIKSYPYQLSLEYLGQHICGATIISTKFAITAGHCTYSANSEALTLRSGSTLRGKGGTVTKIKTIHQNPKFDITTVDYDVSVLELSNNLIFGDGVRSIPLASNEAIEGLIATVSGWGNTKENGKLPEQLQVLQVPIISRLRCHLSYAFLNRITARMLCAGDINGGKDTCQGDSGGPLVVNGQLSGVVSWGFGCARPYFPGVYSNIANKEIRQFIFKISGL